MANLMIHGQNWRDIRLIGCGNRGPMTFAGLWERWDKGAGEPLETFTIIVGPANEQVQPFHDRMPVILEPDDWDLWFSADAKPNELQALLHPYAGELSIQAVSRDVNSPKNDAPSLLEPIAN